MGCVTVNSDWYNVKTVPVLPVEDGAKVEISCSSPRMVLLGSKTATCQKNRLQPANESRKCLKAGQSDSCMYYVK